MPEETKPLRVHGVPKPKGTSWLKEVKVDAARNAVENLRKQAEQKAFEQAKARGITPAQIISKGREDLSRADPNFFGEPDEDAGFDEEDEVEQTEQKDTKSTNTKKGA